MPPYIQEIDHIIITSPADIRHLLIKFYTINVPFYEKAIHLGLDKRSLRRRIERAEYYVHSRLDRLPEKASDSAHPIARVPQSWRRIPQPVPA